MSLVLAGCGSNGGVDVSATTTTPTATTTGVPDATTTTKASTTTAAPATITTAPTTATTGAELIEIAVEDGEVVSGPKRIQADLGFTVHFVVISDVSDHVHVHGYDLFFDVAPGADTEIMFTAEVPGIFEVELEDSHLLLVELEVS